MSLCGQEEMSSLEIDVTKSMTLASSRALLQHKIQEDRLQQIIHHCQYQYENQHNNNINKQECSMHKDSSENNNNYNNDNSNNEKSDKEEQGNGSHLLQFPLKRLHALGRGSSTRPFA